MNCKENCHPHINRISQSRLQTIGYQNLLWHADSWVSSQLFNQTFRVKPSQICSVTISAGESRKHTLKFENHCLRKQRRQWHPTPILLPRKSHGRRSLVGCSPRGREESDTTERHHFDFSLSCIGERNGNPLQCSCLENPRDGGAWWAAVYGVAQSQRRLKRLSSSTHIHTHLCIHMCIHMHTHYFLQVNSCSLFFSCAFLLRQF